MIRKEQIIDYLGDEVVAASSPDLFEQAVSCRRERGDLSPLALAVLKGTRRMLAARGWGAFEEFPLKNGRRADLLCINKSGEIWVVEVKSGFADFRADAKWPAYQDYCDRFFFAVAPDFPVDVIRRHPAYSHSVGVIFADQHGAEIIEMATKNALHASRRKSLIQSVAFIAGRRSLRDIYTADGA